MNVILSRLDTSAYGDRRILWNNTCDIPLPFYSVAYMLMNALDVFLGGVMVHAVSFGDATQAAWEVEVFFDGDCPLCRREITFLRKIDRRRRIRFTDIAAADFSARALGVGHEALMAEIHGRLPDGSWVRGVEVFRRLYAAIGWLPLVAVSRWPGVRQALAMGYRVFARNRLRWTGRCDSTCRLG
jgi:predicted DCC family thiol-disulfide oxidoreductase YuxK